MLFIDDRRGSGELSELLTAYGIKAKVLRMPSCDFKWIGKGPNGDCSVGVERKQIGECIQSLQTRRLTGHQLPEAGKDCDYYYLLVEGFWGLDDSGRVSINKQPQGFSYAALNGYLTTLESKAGVIYRRTLSKAETVATVVGLYRWWTEKPWDEHRSHEAIYAPGPRDRRMIMESREVSACELHASQLPGIDWAARQVANKLKTVDRLCELSEDEWSEMRLRDKNGKFRRIGVARGRKIWTHLHKSNPLARRIAGGSN